MKNRKIGKKMKKYLRILFLNVKIKLKLWNNNGINRGNNGV